MLLACGSDWSSDEQVLVDIEYGAVRPLAAPQSQRRSTLRVGTHPSLDRLGSSVRVSHGESGWAAAADEDVKKAAAFLFLDGAAQGLCRY